jgi:hypothetical protein
MRILGRKLLDRPVILGAGDRLAMSYVEVDGVVRTERVTTFAVVVPSRAITVDEAVLIETEVGGRYAVGGLLLEQTEEAAEQDRVTMSSARMRELRRAIDAQVTIKGRRT